jgi:uncharacterized membrane protein
LVTALARTSFFIFRVMIADALIPFSIVFGMLAIIGETIGNLNTNIYGKRGFIDAIEESLANFVAIYAEWKTGSRNFP